MEHPIKISDRFNPAKLARLNKFELEPIEYIKFRRCNIKILVVTDEGGSFGNASFGLTTFLKAFNEPLAYTSFSVTKAHRGTDLNADISGFRFDTHDLTKFDVIFLFGIERPPLVVNPLSNQELKTIAQYMDNGGGLFATGDHEDFGVELCGKIPRVRSMRRWYTSSNPGPNGEPNAPSQSGGGNHDTVVDTDTITPGLQGSQSDLVPQKIHPKYYTGFATPGFHPHGIFRFVKYPHPVLCSIDGVIKVLPDHMHEGLCEVPTNLGLSFTFDGYNTEEYPLVGTSRLKPEVIASADNHVNDTKFGVIGAYDGHKHSTLGRVLVDATWHHFFNINIQQFESLKDSVDNMGHVPNAAESQALSDYNYIQHYFRNIAYWLARRERQVCFRKRGWIWLLNHSTIRMSIVRLNEKITKFDKFTYFHTLGVLAKNALGDLQSNCQSSALLHFLENIDFLKKDISHLKIPAFSLVDPEIFETVALGSSLHELTINSLNSKGELEEKEMESIIEKSSLNAISETLDFAGQSITNFKTHFSKSIKKSY